MRSALLPLSALLLALAQPALTQDATAPAGNAAAPDASSTAPADNGANPKDPIGYPVGQTVDNNPKSKLVATYDDWEVHCVTLQNGKDNCEMTQLLKQPDGNPVIDVQVAALPTGGKAVAGMTMVTPLMTMLTKGLTIVVDNGAPKTFPFLWCDRGGCYSRLGLLPQDLDQFRKGNQGTVTIVPIAAPDKTVSMALSLKGFTKAFDDLQSRLGSSQSGNGN